MSLADFVILTSIFYLLSFFCAFVYRYFYPSKPFLIERGYQFVLWDMKQNRAKKYELYPKVLRTSIRIYIKGVDKNNSREIAECVLQKLVDNNILELNSNSNQDVYYKK
jgi:hypothetical protein